MSTTIEQVVNEGTTAYVTVAFKNKTGALESPSTIQYRIDDVSSNTEIRGATNLSAGSSVEITLSPVDNRILNIGQAVERRRVSVVATYGSSDQVTSEYIYRVKPLAGVSGNPPAIDP